MLALLFSNTLLAAENTGQKETQMDLRIYFQKLKQVEDTITETYTVIVSNETPDGGKPGVFTEVLRASAAKLVVGGKARLASKEEADDFRFQNGVAKDEADRSALASRVQLNVVSDQDLKAIKTVLKGSRKE